MNDLVQNSYQEIKDSIKTELNRVAESFVEIGYRLKQVRDGELYKIDGYSNINEFAKEEYSLSQSTTSRFIAINDKYSVDGSSPKLLEQYEGYGYSKLSEMLTLNEEDIKLISVKTTVAEIRDVKQIEREVRNEIYATSHNEQTVENTQSEATLEGEKSYIIPEAEKLLISFFRDPTRRGILKELAELFHNHEIAKETVKQAAEIINPSGYRFHREGLIVITFEEQTIKYSNFKSGTREFSYTDFIHDLYMVFNMLAKDPAIEFYGEPEPEPEPKKPEPKPQDKPVDKPAPKVDKKPVISKPVDKHIEKPTIAQPEEKEPEEEDAEDFINEPETEEQLPGQKTISDYPELFPETKEEENVEIVEADIVEKAEQDCAICSKPQYTMYSSDGITIDINKRTCEIVVTHYEGERIKKVDRRPIKYCPDCGKKLETC